jgi:predicted nuclease with TOPRIM domain
LRKTELLADLEALSADYTEANPRIIDLRVELASLDKSLEKVFGVKPSETDKLTLALGKLIVKKAALDSEFSRISRSYNKDHPDAKRARRRVEIFENAIKEVLR